MELTVKGEAAEQGGGFSRGEEERSRAWVEG